MNIFGCGSFGSCGFRRCSFGSCGALNSWGLRSWSLWWCLLMTSVTVMILCFFGLAAFFVFAGSFSFWKSFVRCGPSGLSLTGKDSVITFRISSTLVAEGVAAVSSSSSIAFCFGAEAFLFFETSVFGSGFSFFFFNCSSSSLFRAPATLLLF